MSESLNFKRLWRLICKQGVENARFYLLYALATLGLMLLLQAFLLFTNAISYQEADFWVFIGLALFLSGSIFANLQFQELSGKEKGLYWLNLPASHLEKLLCAVFYTFIAYNLVFLLLVFPVKWLVFTYLEQVFVPAGGKFGLLKAPLYRTEFIYFIHAFIATQAFFLLGSVYFSRFSFVKSTIMGLLLVFGLFAYHGLLSKVFLEPDLHLDGLELRTAGVYDASSEEYFIREYRLPELLSSSVSIFYLYAWAPIFWLITWFRLKEKEI